MGEMHFSDNYTDLCERNGANAGFQFEFYCENCNDRWRTAFVPFRTGQASGWLNRASGFLGGVMGEISSAAEGMAEAGFGKARDKAFAEAVEQAKGHFHRCANCHNYVCDVCWNAGKGLCLGCAPSLEVEAERARNEGALAGVRDKAYLEGEARGQNVDVKKDRQLICPECGAHTEGGKFCPECGAKLAVKSTCPGCSAEVSPGAKFCPECGEKMA